VNVIVCGVVHASDDCNQWIDSVTGLLLSLFFSLIDFGFVC
jgi:hypothetical protein